MTLATRHAPTVIELVPDAGSLEREPERIELAAGEVLFRQGDPGEVVYVVNEGAIEIYHERTGGAEEPLDVLGPDRYFGELAPLLRLPRSASARATGDTFVTA